MIGMILTVLRYCFDIMCTGVSLSIDRDMMKTAYSVFKYHIFDLCILYSYHLVCRDAYFIGMKEQLAAFNNLGKIHVFEMTPCNILVYVDIMTSIARRPYIALKRYIDNRIYLLFTHRMRSTHYHRNQMIPLKRYRNANHRVNRTPAVHLKCLNPDGRIWKAIVHDRVIISAVLIHPPACMTEV